MSPPKLSHFSRKILRENSISSINDYTKGFGYCKIYNSSGKVIFFKDCVYLREREKEGTVAGGVEGEEQADFYSEWGAQCRAPSQNKKMMT